MTEPTGKTDKTVLITGANAGIGKEIARQLALRPEIARIYLACRNEDRAKVAKSDLEAASGRHIFDIISMDVADLGSVRSALGAIDGSIDALIMNAGVIGDKKLMNLTADGVTTLFATNVLGHVALLEGLISRRPTRMRWRYSSEAKQPEDPKSALRGNVKMHRPSFISQPRPMNSPAVIDASYFDGRKFEPNLAFGQVKYIGACGWLTWPANT